MMNTGLIGAALEEGQLFVAEDANKKVVGTISWFPPGTERLGRYVASACAAALSCAIDQYIDFPDDPSDVQRSRGSNAFAAKAIEQRPEAYKWYMSAVSPKHDADREALQ